MLRDLGVPIPAPDRRGLDLTMSRSAAQLVHEWEQRAAALAQRIKDYSLTALPNPRANAHFSVLLERQDALALASNDLSAGKSPLPDLTTTIKKLEQQQLPQDLDIVTEINQLKEMALEYTRLESSTQR